MKNRINILESFRFIISVLLFTQATYAQENSWAKENVDFSGYIKYLNTSQFQSFDAILSDNLLHNRLNLKVYLNDNFSTALEVRNRVFWGNSLKVIPNFATQIDSDIQDIDLSTNSVDEPALLIHSKIDRLYVDYQSDKWHVVLGRQRINWGKNLAWNPNDLFNAYSFFDFDYEERPGADALRVQYYTSGNTSFESAINYTDKWEDNTFAVKYNFNKYNYDFQLLAAKYINDYTFGVGWEGAIKNVGVKGELSYFIPNKNAKSQDKVFVSAISIDYYFKNGLSTNLGTLYNSLGVKDQSEFDIAGFSNFSQTAKTLMPNRWSFFGQISKSLTPALNASFSTIYAYELNGVYMMPQISYNLVQNWDFDVVGQVFYGKYDEKYSNLSNTISFRFRWSY